VAPVPAFWLFNTSTTCWPFDLESGVRVTCDVGYLCASFSVPRPLRSRVRPDVRDRQTSDRQRTSDISCLYRCNIRYKDVVKQLHSSPPSTKKIFVGDTSLNFLIIQDSLTRQLFSMVTSSLLQSLRIACSLTVFPSVRFGVLNCPLFAFKFQQLPQSRVIDCRLFSHTPLAKCYRTWLVLSSVIAADA